MVDGLGRIAELVSKEQPVFLQNFMEERGISPPEPKTLPRR